MATSLRVPVQSSRKPLWNHTTTAGDPAKVCAIMKRMPCVYLGQRWFEQFGAVMGSLKSRGQDNSIYDREAS